MSQSLMIASPQRFAQLADFLQKASELARELSQSTVAIPPDQQWFWSDRWQALEQEADEALARGEYKSFDTVDDFLKDLHAQV